MLKHHLLTQPNGRICPSGLHSAFVECVAHAPQHMLKGCSALAHAETRGGGGAGALDGRCAGLRCGGSGDSLCERGERRRAYS